MKVKKITAMMLSVMLSVALLPQNALAAYETHRIAIGSDRHGNTEAIGEAMGGMPSSVEYVSIIGDLVGGSKEKAPEFTSKDVFDEIMGLGFSKVTGKDEMSIVWADHDAKVNDEAEIVFANEGYGSGLMYTGKNSDGHNHTTESKSGQYSGEFFIPRGAKMEIGAEEDYRSFIYYTYLTAGYLNQNKTATLITINSSKIKFSKYQSGEVSDEVYDTESKKSGAFATKYVTKGVKKIKRVTVNTEE